MIIGGLTLWDWCVVALGALGALGILVAVLLALVGIVAPSLLDRLFAPRVRTVRPKMCAFRRVLGLLSRPIANGTPVPAGRHRPPGASQAKPSPTQLEPAEHLKQPERPGRHRAPEPLRPPIPQPRGVLGCGECGVEWAVPAGADPATELAEHYRTKHTGDTGGGGETR